MALVLKTLSDSKDAQRDLSKLQESVVGIETSVNKANKAFVGIAQSVAALATVAFTLKSLTSVGDQITNLENRLKTVTKTQLQFNKALDGVKQISLETRSSLESVARLYQRIAVNSDDIGINQKDTLKVTKAVAQTLKLSGASAAEATSSLLQFGQAIGSGKLAGDELRSTLESNVVLARIIADTFKVPIGDLKKLGEAGTLVTGKVLQGIVAKADELEESFGKLGVTFEDAFGNIGTSFVLLFSSLKKSFLGTGNGLATFINNIALAIGDIARNLDIFLYNARAKLTFFIFDAIMLFGDLWKVIRQVGRNIYEMLSGMVDEWRPTIESLLSSVKSVAIATGTAILALYNTIASALRGSTLFNGLVTSLKDAFYTVSAFVSQLFKNIQLPSIDTEKIFKGLKSTLNIVKGWAKTVERWFFWLYDKVIGNSWIPDLVEGTQEWFNKLLGTPLDTLKTFANKANFTFSKISLGLSGAFAVGSLLKYKKQLLALSVIAGGIGVYSAFKEKQSKDSSITFSSEAKSLWNNLTETLQDFSKSINKWLGDNTLSRTLKQALGLRDKVKGSVFGDKIDTGAYVGRGASRDQKDRPFGHDLFNVLPSNWQVPIVAAVTGAVALGIVSTFQSSAVRIGLISLASTAAAIFATKVIDPAAISQTLFGIVNLLIKAVASGLNAVLGGNALFNPKELLFFLAKLALVFKAGRDLWVKAITGIAKAPTSAGLNVADYFLRKETVKNLEQAERDVKNIPSLVRGAKEGLKSSRDLFAQQVRLLAKEKDAAGNIIGARRAYTNAKEGNVGRFGDANAEARLQRTIYASNATKKAFDRVANIKTETDGIVAAKNDLAKTVKAMQESASKRTENLIAGARSGVGATAGIIGGVAGYQLGVQITKGMTGSSEWVKMATVLVTAMSAQMVIAFGAVTLFNGIVTAIKVGGAAFVARLAVALAATNPWVIGAGIIFGALYLGWKLFADLPKNWLSDLRGEKGFFGAEISEIDKKLPQASQQVVKDFFNSAVEKLKGLNNDYTNKLKFGFVPGSTGQDLTSGFFPPDNSDSRISTALDSPFSKLKVTAQDTAGKTLNTIKDFGETALKNLKELWESRNEKPEDKEKATKENAKITNAATDEIVGTLKAQLAGSKTSTATAGLIATALAGVGAKDVSADQLSKQTPRVLGQLADAIDNIQGYTTRAAQVGNDSYIGKNFLYQAEVGRGKLQELLDRASLAFEPDSKFTTNKEDDDTKNFVTFGEQLDIINKTFPDINLSLAEFIKLSDETRNRYYGLAKSIAAPLEKINSTSLGGPLGSETIKPTGVTSKLVKIEEERKKGEAQILSELEQIRTPYSQFKTFFEKFGVGITEDLFNILEDVDKFKLGALKNQVEANAKILAKPLSDDSITDNVRADVQKAQTELLAQLTSITETATRNVGTRFKVLQNNFSYLGLDIERAVYNRLTENEKTMMENVAKRLNNLQNDANNGNIGAQIQFEQVSEAVRNFQWSKFNSASRGVGEAFAGEVNNSFQQGLSDALKGKKDEHKSIWETFTTFLIDSFTNNVIDTFTRGVAMAFTGEKSILNSALTELGGGIFNLGAGGEIGSKSNPAWVQILEQSIAQGAEGRVGPIDPIGDAMAGINGEIKKVYESVKTSIKSAFDDIDFSGIFDSLTSAFSNFDFTSILGGLTSIFGFATGGMIRGPGSGISDSIPIMASNGEFIVNAKSARKYAPILHAINNGQLPKFASGGEVGSMEHTSKISGSGIGSTQIINLSITGDISRQTRAEIYGMLPQIANGVNSHNRDKGYKG